MVSVFFSSTDHLSVSKNVSTVYSFNFFVKICRINTYNALSVQVPFGGYKQSGFGRDAGMDSLNAYSEIKSVIVKIPQKNS